MPLRINGIQGSSRKELLSFPGSINDRLLLLKDALQIPNRRVVEGTVVPISKLCLNLIGQAVENGLTKDSKRVRRSKAVHFLFPGEFAAGDIFFASAKNQKDYQYKAVLSFRKGSTPIIEYKTHKNLQEDVTSMLEKVAVLGSLPEEVFNKVQQRKSIIVIYDGLHGTSKILKLHWDEKLGYVKASNIIAVPQLIGEKTNNDNIKVLEKTIQDTSAIYFVLNDVNKLGV